MRRRKPSPWSRIDERLSATNDGSPSYTTSEASTPLAAYERDLMHERAAAATDSGMGVVAARTSPTHWPWQNA